MLSANVDLKNRTQSINLHVLNGNMLDSISFGFEILELSCSLTPYCVSENVCFLIFLQNQKGWRTSHIYTNFEDVLLGAYICQSVNGNKRVGSEASISMQYFFFCSD